jgi:uncharacterized membrane protein YadS
MGYKKSASILKITVALRGMIWENTFNKTRQTNEGTNRTDKTGLRVGLVIFDSATGLDAKLSPH